MRFDYEMRYGLPGALLDRLIVRRSVRGICETLMDNWQRKIEGTPDTEQHG